MAKNGKSKKKQPTITFYIYSDGRKATVKKVPLKTPEDKSTGDVKPRKRA